MNRVKAMSEDQKQKVEEWSTWITRGLILIIGFMLANMLSRFDTMETNMQELVSEKKVLTQRLNTVESQVTKLSSDMNDIFKNYELKPKR